LRNDPQSRQEVGRLLLEAVVPRAIEAISSDPNHPVFLPSINATLNVHQPNADTIYFNADISDDGVFRIRGDRGSVRILRVAQFPTVTGEIHVERKTSTFQALGQIDLNTLHADKDGHIDLILSRTRPENYTGDWWELKQGTGYLVMRSVSSDWRKERDPRLSIERLDKPVQKPRPSAAELEAKLRHLATTIGFTALSHVAHAEDLRAQGFINKVKIMHTPGALMGQFYYEGAYDITPDDALIVESKVPAKCGYWSTLLTNDIYETTDWVNNQSSLNDAQAHVDSDGMVRFVVSMKDPGVPNWLDPAGYPTGAVQGRWTDCDAQPIPTVKKVKFKDLRKALPKDTPVVTAQQREQTIRDRRAAFLQRPFW
jgi:hypothetical protein